jgi:hypothetical protein
MTRQRGDDEVTDTRQKAIEVLLDAIERPNAWRAAARVVDALTEHLRSQPPPPAPKAEGGEVSDAYAPDKIAPLAREALRLLGKLREAPHDVAWGVQCTDLGGYLARLEIMGEQAETGRASLAAELEAVRYELAETSTMLKRNQEALHRLAAVPAVSERITVAAPVATAVDAAIAELAEKDRRLAELEGNGVTTGEWGMRGDEDERGPAIVCYLPVEQVRRFAGALGGSLRISVVPSELDAIPAELRPEGK